MPKQLSILQSLLKSFGNIATYSLLYVRILHCDAKPKREPQPPEKIYLEHSGVGTWLLPWSRNRGCTRPKFLFPLH